MQCSYVSIERNPSGWDVVLKKCPLIKPNMEAAYVISKTDLHFAEFTKAEEAAEKFAKEKKLIYLFGCGVSYFSWGGEDYLMPVLIMPHKLISGSVYPSFTEEAFYVGAKTSQHFGAPFVPIKAQVVPISANL